MTAPIGYYVHHQGRGHLDRFRAVRAVGGPVADRLVALTELAGDGPDDGRLVLPPDVPPGAPDDAEAGGALHWAPLGVDVAAPRLATLVGWLAEHRPTGVVVDVSVEAALACRLAGVPTVVVRQHGDRDDAPHRLGRATARRLAAPFPRRCEHPSTPAEVREATDYWGFVAPPSTPPTGGDGSAQPSDEVGGPVRADDVVVVWGRGGGRLAGSMLDAIAGSTTGRVLVAGRDVWDPADRPTDDRVVELGWVPSPSELLTDRPTFVAAAGNATVGLVATAGCPLVVVPQPRPFDEQLRAAEALDAAGLAAVAPPQDERDAWTRAIELARARGAGWVDVETDGAERAAASIGRWLT